MRRIGILLGSCCLAMLVLASSAPALGTSAPTKMTPLKLQRLTAPATACAGENDRTASVAVQEAAMECLINLARERAGLPRLIDTRKLDSSAANKAGDIIRCNDFSHQACGRDFLFWFRHAGYAPNGCWWAGENLAWGSGEMGTARSMLKAWLRSPGHRANILSGSYKQFGVALRIGGLSGSSDAHVWVNHFGSRC